MRAATLRDALGRLFRALPPGHGKLAAGLRLQRALVRLDGSTEEVVTVRMRDGSRLLVDLRTRTERRAFWTGEYDARPIRVIAALLPSGAQVVDVGANVGFWTVGLSVVLPDARVLAVEPLPANARRLEENLALNGLADRVAVVQTALGAGPGTLHLVPERDGTTGNAAPGAGAHTIAVEVLTLDALVSEHALERCDFLKIDVEGGELSVLRGAADLLERTRPLVLAELNPYWMAEAGWDAGDLLALLEPLGYEARAWDGRAFASRAIVGAKGASRDVLFRPSV